MRLLGLLLSLSMLACGAAEEPRPTRVPGADPFAAGGETPARMELRMIVVLWEGAGEGTHDITRTRAQAAARAETIAALARDSEDFQALSTEYSDVPSVGEAQTYVIEEGRLPDEVVREATRTAVGRTSGAIETNAGFFIVQRRPDPPPGPPSISARHILVMHVDSQRVPDDVTRSREEALELASDILRRLRAGEDWNDLHAEYSDEPGDTGGDLGTFQRGMMVPAFEETAFLLDVGELSEVVETPFGFHVILRYE